MDSLFLQVKDYIGYLIGEDGLNPCFNGFTILTHDIHFLDHVFITGLNPCFNGFTILTGAGAVILSEGLYWSQSLF